MSLLIFAIKLTHSLIVIVLFACLYIVWRYALNGVYRRWVGWASALLLAEAIIYIGWGFRCPLTDWAVALGDPTGADLLSELLLLEGVNFVESGALFFVIGIVLALRRWHREGRTHVHAGASLAGNDSSEASSTSST